MSISQNDKTIYLKKALKKTPYLQESQGQILDSLKESPIQKECDALKQVILSNRKKHNVRRSLQMTLLSFHSIDD